MNPLDFGVLEHGRFRWDASLNLELKSIILFQLIHGLGYPQDFADPLELKLLAVIAIEHFSVFAGGDDRAA